MIKGATTKRGSTCISSIGWNHQARYNGNIRLTERPTHTGNRAPKRNIREVLSDHSLSS